MDTPPRNYNPLEPVIYYVNRNFVALAPEDKKTYRSVLKSIATQITTQMKKCDRLFNSMLTSIFYGGSFYDGLKLAPPDEFDLDLLLSFPKELNFDLADATNIPGYVRVRLQDHKPSIESLDMNKYNGLNKMVNGNHYLEKSEVLSWMQGVLDKALNKFKQESEGQYIFKTPHGSFYITKSASGPASTLIAAGEIGGEEIELSIDLVPCFVFGKDHWPQGSFRQNTVSEKPNFFIVPKPIIKGISNSDHFWRLSFQEQERVIIFHKYALKPSIRLIKKIKELLDHKAIASYYITTVALWMLEENPNFWRNSSRSNVFMMVLKKYQKYLEDGFLPYYWNSKCDLLENVDDATLINISNKIKRIIVKIDNLLDDGGDPNVVAEYLGFGDNARSVEE